MSYKSVSWWEEEVAELIFFFDNLENKKFKYSKRIIDDIVIAYAALCGRANVESKILEGMEKEFKKYNASKKKK